ncbi:unnamed protein product [Allacma fusca]|uniref:Uncharacterized protein n=1 Tax=Allacma fusca TaxID=39272 RepID=A0A8J2K3D0_9HEXA|nr:unnamed protein product [Allacma fusca]
MQEAQGKYRSMLEKLKFHRSPLEMLGKVSEVSEKLLFCNEKTHSKSDMTIKDDYFDILHHIIQMRENKYKKSCQEFGQGDLARCAKSIKAALEQDPNCTHVRILKWENKLVTNHFISLQSALRSKDRFFGSLPKVCFDEAWLQLPRPFAAEIADVCTSDEVHYNHLSSGYGNKLKELEWILEGICIFGLN